MEFTIRSAVKEDAQALIEYVNLIAGESDNLTFGVGEFGMTVEEEERFLENASNHPDNLYLLATNGHDILGSLNLNVGHRPRIAHAGEFGVSVRQSAWGHGIGRALISEMIEVCKRNGRIRKINLRVRCDNIRAIGLYKSLGFKNEGRITREFLIDGEFFDTFHMGLEI